MRLLEIYVGAARRVCLCLWICLFVSWRVVSGATLSRLASVKLSSKAVGVKRKVPTAQFWGR